MKTSIFFASLNIVITCNNAAAAVENAVTSHGQDAISMFLGNVACCVKLAIGKILFT